MWALRTGRLVRDASNQPLYHEGAVLDVTDRRRAEEAGRRLASIVESSQDAILSKSLNGIILTWNTGAEHLYGYAAAEIIGRPASMLVPPDRARSWTR